MGIDYYRCKKCNIQVDDCIGGYDHCECDSVICYRCCWKLKVREKPADFETPGKRIEKKDRWGFLEMGITHENAEEWDYCLIICPYCEKEEREKTRAKTDKKLLTFLLKRCKLTRRSAIKEMSAQ